VGRTPQPRLPTHTMLPSTSFKKCLSRTSSNRCMFCTLFGSPAYPEAQFQQVNDPSDPAIIHMVNEARRAYVYAPAGELKLTSPLEVLQVIRGLKVGKAPGPNVVPSRVLRHLPLRAINFLTNVFNAVLRRQYFPSAWKHARVVSILTPGKDPMLPSSYRPTSLLWRCWQALWENPTC
jgi:hypothetical protein